MYSKNVNARKLWKHLATPHNLAAEVRHLMLGMRLYELSSEHLPKALLVRMNTDTVFQPGVFGIDEPQVSFAERRIMMPNIMENHTARLAPSQQVLSSEWPISHVLVSLEIMSECTCFHPRSILAIEGTIFSFRSSIYEIIQQQWKRTPSIANQTATSSNSFVGDIGTMVSLLLGDSPKINQTHFGIEKMQLNL
ncbi:hypothetical protein M422DRAFT_44697 [Sphaerobolus stellatus SS14]|nr:hypothetical protein M422DRAFT_44697 [Sphaerobolus stellatus SS14]